MKQGEPPRAGSGWSALRLASEVLAAYSQVFFAHGRRAGLLVAAATFTAPRVGFAGVCAVLVAAALVRLLRLDAARAERGHWGYNALLAGLAVGAFVAPSGGLLGVSQLALLVVLAASAALLLHAALETTSGGLLGLPVLTLPFVGATWLVLSALPRFGALDLERSAYEAALHLPAVVSLYLRSLGAMFFVPSELAGALVLASLLAWSRIAALLSLLGFAAAELVLELVTPSGAASGALPLVMGYNGAATAMALGGVWFVPQRASFVLGLLAVPLTVTLALALAGPLGSAGLPLLILPFNLAMGIMLPAMRQRTRDSAPKAVDFEPGTPEANLNYYRTRLARFGERSSVRLRLPFSGRWTVTQGVDGDHTHQQQWRHALDFEAIAEDGSRNEGAGASLRDFYSYRLPVLATAAGTVVKVVNHVPDNPPGERNPHDVWGNLVIIQHGPSLYSLVAHLAPGSVEVAEGQFVLAGARVGACGNSGRSFVPHLHFHLQSGPRPGASTVEFELSDVVTEEAGSEPRLAGGSRSWRVRSVHLPGRGEVVRPVEPRDDVAALFQIPIGARMTFEVGSGESGGAELARHRETVGAEIDLANHTFLESERGGRLFFERQPHQFIVYDHIGDPESVLRWIYTALPRVPFEIGVDLGWEDVLPSRAFRAGFTRWLLDFVDPFLPTAGQRLRFHVVREAGALVVLGSGRHGRRVITTRAVLVPREGLREVELRVGGVVRRARRIDQPLAPVESVGREAA